MDLGAINESVIKWRSYKNQEEIWKQCKRFVEQLLEMVKVVLKEEDLAFRWLTPESIPMLVITSEPPAAD